MNKNLLVTLLFLLAAGTAFAQHKFRFNNDGKFKIVQFTDIMLRALEKVCARYPRHAEMVRVESVPFDQYIQLMQGCHVILDQLYSYTPAMNALEAMKLPSHTHPPQQTLPARQGGTGQVNIAGIVLPAIAIGSHHNGVAQLAEAIGKGGVDIAIIA